MSNGTLVWRDGIEKWKPLSEVSELGTPQDGAPHEEAPKGRKTFNRILDLVRQAARSPILVQTLRDPEKAFEQADTLGARQVASLVLVATLLLGLLVPIPAVVKGMYEMQAAEQQMMPDWATDGEEDASEGEGIGAVLKEVFLRVIPRTFILQLVMFGVTYVSIAACLALFGMLTQVWSSSFVILGLSLVPLAAALAIVFVLAWLHEGFYALCGYAGFVAALFLYQGLRTVGRLPAGKAAYCLPVILGLGLALGPYLLLMATRVAE